MKVHNAKNLHHVHQGALVCKKLIRFGIGHDPDIIVKNVPTLGVVNAVPSDRKNGNYVISFDGGMVMDLKLLAFCLLMNMPERNTKKNSKKKENRKPERDHELEHRQIMYNGALSVAGVVDSDDSSIQITEVIPVTKNDTNDFDGEIMITKVKAILRLYDCINSVVPKSHRIVQDIKRVLFVLKKL
jgi:hypothetical protein